MLEVFSEIALQEGQRQNVLWITYPYLHRTLAVEEISKYDLSSCYQRYGGPLERLKPKPDREATK